MLRSSGILLHPTSLPGSWPIGDLGEQAFGFIDFLHKAGQSVWQVLPLGPTGYGHSPYNTLSAFAGNTALIDLQQLVIDQDLDQAQIQAAVNDCPRISFIQAHELKHALLADPLRYERLAERSRRLGEVMLAEVQQWRLHYETRPLSLPG